MNQLLMPAHNDLTETVCNFPTVSIIMPFEPKMTSKKVLSDSLNSKILKAEQHLMQDFPVELALLVINKLKTVIKGLNYGTHKKSIAIYVSPLFEKILYLDMELNDQLVIDNVFNIRDIVNRKKEVRKYLVLVFGEEQTKIYFDNNAELQQVFSNRSEFRRNIEELIFTPEYLQHIDVILGVVLQSFKIPVFVLGDEKVIYQFKNITRHAASIIGYAEHNGKNISPDRLKKTMSPIINNWACVKQENIKLQLHYAAGANKVVSGIEEVFSKAMQRHGYLLLVEKNYEYPAGYNSSEELIAKAVQPYSQFSYINDAVDDVIEKVLEENGDVEFVDKELLKDYDHIALIL